MEGPVEGAASASTETLRNLPAGVATDRTDLAGT